MVAYALAAVASAVAAGWVAGKERWVDAALFLLLALAHAYLASLWAGIRAIRAIRVVRRGAR